MKKCLILLRKNSFTYNQQKYGIEELSNLCDEDNQRFFVIILEEELYAKHFCINKNRIKFLDFIERKIKSEFPQNGDMLYDYEKTADNITAIYSLKGGMRISILEKCAYELNVKPLQIIIRDIFKEILKEQFTNSKSLIRFENYYYYISLKKGLFFYCFAEKDLETMVQRIIETNENGILNVDEKINNLDIPSGRFKINHMKIEDYIYEKIYEKQKLHIRKFL